MQHHDKTALTLPRTTELPHVVEQSLTRWLASWDWTAKPGNPLPLAVIPSIEPALARAEAILAPASPKVFVMEMDRLLEFAQAFGVAGSGDDEVRMSAMTDAFKQALLDLPGDLLHEAISRTMAQHEWNTKPPLPSQVRTRVASEMARRRAVVNRLRCMRDWGIAPLQAPLGIDDVGRDTVITTRALLPGALRE